MPGDPFYSAQENKMIKSICYILQYNIIGCCGKHCLSYAQQSMTNVQSFIFSNR